MPDFPERIDAIDVKRDWIPDSPNEMNIKNKAREYVLLQMKNGLQWDDLQRLFDNLKTLLERQDIERLNIEQEFEKAKWDVWQSTQTETGVIKTEREKTQQETILEQTDLSGLSYMDMERDTTTGEYKVSQAETLDPYDRQELARFINILKDPRTEERIRFAKMNPLDIRNLSPKELLVLNTINQMNSNEKNHSILASNDTVSILWGIPDVPTTGGMIGLNTGFKEKYDSFIDNLTEILKWGVYATKTLWRWIGNFKSQTQWEKEQKLHSMNEKWYVIMKQMQDSKTGFSMTVMKNTDKSWKEKYTFAMRWTNEWKDIKWSDVDIWNERLPEQMISLVRTLNRDEDMRKILEDKNSEIEVTWHSLGWNLAQIMTALYPDRIKQAYSFNWPWVRQLWKIDQKTLNELKKEDVELSGLVLSAQQQFFENRDNPRNSFVNVMNVVNKDRIGNTWTHIWLKTAEFWTDSHFLWDLRENVEKLSEAEFRRVFDFLFKKRDSQKKND